MQAPDAPPTYQDVYGWIAELCRGLNVTRANDLMTKFERLPAAWEISFHLLSEASLEHRFFGAKTLYSKLQRQFLQLETMGPQYIPDLVANLTNKLRVLGAEQPLDMRTCRYICLSLSVIALQTSHPNSVSHLLTNLSSLVSVSPEIVLEFMMLLPEELDNHNIDVPRENKDDFCRQLESAMSDVLSFLGSIWNTTNAAVRVKALDTVDNWIYFAPAKVETLLQHPLVLATVEQLGSRTDLLAPSLKIWSHLMPKWPGNMHMAELLRPKLPFLFDALRDLLNQYNSNSQNKDVAYTLEKLVEFFTALAESFISEILYGAQGFQDQTLLNALLEVCSIHDEHKISIIPLTYFETLARYIGDSENLCNQCSGLFVKLLEISLKQLVVSEEDLEDENCESLEARQCWKYAIEDAADVVGDEVCRNIIAHSLFNAFKNGNKPNLGEIEAGIYAFQAVASCRNPNDDVMKGIMSLILQTPCPVITKEKKTFDKYPVIAVTVVKAFSKSSRWILDNQECVPHVIEKITAELTMDAAALYASEALKVLTSTSNPAVNALCLELIKFYNNSYENIARINVEAELNVLESVSDVIGKLPSDERMKAIKLLIDPIGNRLTNHRERRDFKRLKAIIMFQDPETVAIIFQWFNPIITNILQDPNTSIEFRDTIVSYLKHTLRLSWSAQVYKDITQLVYVALQRRVCQSSVYLLSVLIKEYEGLGNRESMSLIVEALNHLCNNYFFTTFTSLAAFASNAELVEDFFYMLLVVLNKNYVDLFPNEGILQAAIEGMKSEAEGVQRSCICFVEKAVSTPKYSQSCAMWGLHIVQSCFYVLSGFVPMFGNDQDSTTVSDVLIALKRTFPNMFPSWIATCVQSLDPTAQTIANRLNLVQRVCEPENNDGLLYAVSSYYRDIHRSR